MAPRLLCIVLSLAALVLAQNGPVDGPRVTATEATRVSQIISGLSSYITHLTAQPEYTSVASALATALPPSVLSELATKPGPLGGALPTGTENVQTQSWFTQLPTDVQSYFASAASAESSIALESASGMANGAKTSTGRISELAVGAAGLLGLAAFLI